MTEPKTEIAHISTPKAHYTLDFGSGTLQVKPIITNADKIRAMTDEELAQYICKTQYREGDVCPPTHNCAIDKSCEKCWLDWLKREADGDNDDH